VQVLRLETENGQGVYSGGFGWRYTRAALEDNRINEQHPGPEFDPLLKDFWLKANYSSRRRTDWELNGRKEWFFGFLNQDQMLRWFPREGLRQMAQKANERNTKIYLARYSINGNRVKKGNEQVMLHKKYSKLVERIPLETWLTT
jgi:hypothetical protein